jgi:hypothetical protein
MDGVKVKMMMSCALKGQRPGGKEKPSRSRSVRVSLVQHPSFFMVQASGFSFPLVRSQHPSIRLSPPWRSDLIIPPYVPAHREKSYIKKKYAL